MIYCWRKFHCMLLKYIELEWFKSYLHQRQQAVLFNGKLSSFVDISSGVRERSVLGPFLFILFINDISNFAANGCLINLFADDKIIYTSGNSIDEVQSKLQTCLDNICNRYNRNRLVINIEKSEVMILGSTWQLKSLDLDDPVINYNDTPLELVERAKYLGMFIDSDISSDFHIQNLCKQRHNVHKLSEVWDEIIYPFPNFNGCTIVVWEWKLFQFYATLYNGFDCFSMIG